MNKKIFIITSLLILALPVWALDCNRKPCHGKCINFQPTSVQLQCKCDARKKGLLPLLGYKLWSS